MLIGGNHATTINSRFVAPQAQEQGIQQGAQETTRKLILATLAFRLEPEVVQTFKPVLDAIDDLQRLEQLFNAAMQVETRKTSHKH